MTPLHVAFFACSLGCVTVQELGNERPPAATSGSAAPAATTAPTLEPQLPDTCPNTAPLHGTDCALNVGWCSYRVAPAKGLAAKCACASDRRWSCLLVRDDDRRNPLPIEQLSLTTAACVEGAPCAESTKCSVVRERTCVCMSSGTLKCERPIY